MNDEMHDGASSWLEAMKARLSDPFLFALTLSLVTINWPFLYILLTHKGPPIVAIGQAWHWLHLWGKWCEPLGLAVAYTVGYPLVRLVFVALRELVLAWTRNVVDLVTRRVRWMDAGALHTLPAWSDLKNAENKLESQIRSAWNMVGQAQGVQPQGGCADLYNLGPADARRVVLPALLEGEHDVKRASRVPAHPTKEGRSYVVAFGMISETRYLCAPLDAFLTCEWPSGVTMLHWDGGKFVPLIEGEAASRFRIERVNGGPMGKFFVTH